MDKEKTALFAADSAVHWLQHDGFKSIVDALAKEHELHIKNLVAEKIKNDLFDAFKEYSLSPDNVYSIDNDQIRELKRGLKIPSIPNPPFEIKKFRTTIPVFGEKPTPVDYIDGFIKMNIRLPSLIAGDSESLYEWAFPLTHSIVSVAIYHQGETDSFNATMRRISLGSSLFPNSRACVLCHEPRNFDIFGSQNIITIRYSKYDNFGSNPHSQRSK